jgi:tRNA(Ile)-lysidine synthase
MINDTFLDTIKEYKMLKPKDRVLVAVSGGADSSALLYLLNSFKEELSLDLHVAHLNHTIRKDDAELDVRYVQSLAQKLRLPVTVESFDVQSFAREEKMSLEEAARAVRYAFFDKIANKINADRIAVGHTADDNVETFLMRLLRGSGVKGLCGIPAMRGKIIRPLIRVWRREVEVFVSGLKLVPRRDYTNYESKYLRNRVRLKLIPQLKIYNPKIKEIILQTILLLTEDGTYLEAKAEELLEKALSSAKNDELSLDADKIRKLEYPIQGHILRKAIEKVKGNLFEVSFKHIREVLDKIASGKNWEIHLPDSTYLRGSRKEIIICRDRDRLFNKKSYFYSFSIPGEIDIQETGKKISAAIVPEMESGNNPRVAYVDYSALGRNLIVRNKEDGDRLIPLGMKGSKKLQDLFVDEKIAAEDRDSIPIVESKGKIVWVAGLRLDERAKVTPDTKKIVRLEFL